MIRHSLLLATLFFLAVCGSARAADRMQPWNIADPQLITAISGSASSAGAALNEDGKPGALELTFQPQTDWPFAALPLSQPQDWSSYSYLALRVFNAQDKDVTVTFEIRDASKRQYKPARRLPAGKWQEFRLPITRMAAGTDSGWCGDAIDVHQIDSMAFVANQPRDTWKVRVSSISLVRVPGLPAPKLTAAGRRDGVQLSWKPLPGAIAYDIFRAEAGGTPSRLSRFPFPRFVDTTAAAGVKYSYQVTAINEMGEPGERSQPAIAARVSKGAAALPPLDRFGGRADIKLKATGFFRTQKYNGRWILADPEGHPFFSVGIDVISRGDTYTRVSKRTERFADVLAEKDDPRFKDAWTPPYGFSPYGLDENGLVISRYVRGRILANGAEWLPRWRQDACKRLASWNVNTFGAWCETETIQLGQRPYVSFGAGWGNCPSIPGARFPDVFDPAFEKNVDESARKTAEQKQDPMLIGRFSDNELEWYGDWQHGMGLVDLAQAGPETLAAKRAWVDFLQQRYGDAAKLNAAWGTQFATLAELRAWKGKIPNTPAAQADKSAFLQVIADRYFSVTVAALHRHDPNHLALGARYAGNAPEEAIRAAAKYCDVVSINNYEMTPGAERFARFAALGDKPWLIGEFSFRGKDSGLPNTAGAGNRVENQTVRGEAYQNYLAEALAIPNLVGAHWFQYIDEPATGRFDNGKDGGEDSNYGWVNVDDKPYEAFVSRAALINANAPLALQ